MSVLRRLAIRMFGRGSDGSGRLRTPQWSKGLLAQVDEQFDLWEGVYTRLNANNKLLGTSQMITYSKQERGQLAILVQNMKQFAASIGGDQGIKITQLHHSTQEVLREYDKFLEQAKLD